MSEVLAFVIEDDYQLAHIYAEALRTAGYEPEVISDGRTALSRIREATPTLILLDLHLPEISGKDLWQAIRAEPSLNDTQVVITTADAILAEEMRDDVDLILLKPIGFVQLQRLASRMLRIDP
jgi:DNA-binding response OmpR family regulator